MYPVHKPSIWAIPRQHSAWQRPLRKPELLLRKYAFYDSAHDVCLLVMHT